MKSVFNDALLKKSLKKLKFKFNFNSYFLIIYNKLNIKT